jgi:hypothetical protein
MLNLRYNINGNTAEDLVGQLDNIREAARVLTEALAGDFIHGRNYQLSLIPVTAREQDFVRVAKWLTTVREIEDQVTETLVSMMGDDRVRAAWNALQRKERV